MKRISLSLLAVAALGSVLVSADARIDALRAKLRNQFGQGASYAAANSFSGGYNGGAAAGALASGQYGGAAAAAATGAYNGYQAPQQPTYQQAQPVYQHYQPAPVAAAPVRYAPVGAASSSASVYSAPAPVAAPLPARPVQMARPGPPAVPVRPDVSVEQYAAPIRARRGPIRSRFGGASAAAASAVGGGAAAAAAVSAGQQPVQVHQQQTVEQPAIDVSQSSESYAAAATGTLANQGAQREASSYKRNTESLEKQESGKEDDDHYYSAQSYGSSEDENLHEAFNDFDEDVEATANVYRSKKSGANYIKDFNKSVKASGTGVLAKDKHSSAYKKNSKRFNENVDQSHQSESNGRVENVNQATQQDLHDEDEEIYDSDGYGAHVHHAPAAALAASSAVGGGLGGGVATSAALSRSA